MAFQLSNRLEHIKNRAELYPLHVFGSGLLAEQNFGDDVFVVVHTKQPHENAHVVVKSATSKISVIKEQIAANEQIFTFSITRNDLQLVEIFLDEKLIQKQVIKVVECQSESSLRMVSNSYNTTGLSTDCMAKSSLFNKSMPERSYTEPSSFSHSTDVLDGTISNISSLTIERTTEVVNVRCLLTTVKPKLCDVFVNKENLDVISKILLRYREVFESAMPNIPKTLTTNKEMNRAIMSVGGNKHIYSQLFCLASLELAKFRKIVDVFQKIESSYSRQRSGSNIVPKILKLAKNESQLLDKIIQEYLDSNNWKLSQLEHVLDNAIGDGREEGETSETSKT